MTQADTMPTTSNRANSSTQASRHGTSAAVTAASVHPTIPMTVGGHGGDTDHRRRPESRSGSPGRRSPTTRMPPRTTQTCRKAREWRPSRAPPAPPTAGGTARPPTPVRPVPPRPRPEQRRTRWPPDLHQQSEEGREHQRRRLGRCDGSATRPVTAGPRQRSHHLVQAHIRRPGQHGDPDRPASCGTSPNAGASTSGPPNVVPVENHFLQNVDDHHGMPARRQIRRGADYPKSDSSRVENATTTAPGGTAARGARLPLIS